ncbi:hypothetical protein [Paenibacillus xylanexedens]|uniref:hypothetical protein n=1 Tax=Paenibacillus xylanexedens TaxID=528191 RepID=UPI000F52F5F5|nr:hypothetical protein [Paenibacillus xylanexedens]
MPDVSKLLARGLVTAGIGIPQTIYTPPSGAKAIVIKSMMLNNSSPSPIIVSVLLNGYHILINYSIKPNDSIIVPVVDQILSGTGDTIKISASVTSVISYYISGVEYETNDVNSDYYYARQIDRTTIAAADGNKGIGSVTAAKRIIKSLVVCNPNNTEVSFSIAFAGTWIVNAFKVKAYDTILVPTFDAVLEPGFTITCNANNLISLHLSGKDVT